MKLIIKASIAILMTSVLASCATAPNDKSMQESVVSTKQVQPTTTKTKNAENENGLICKRDAVVGTRFKSKRCLTKEQWSERARDAKEMTGAAQDKSSRNMQNPDG